MRKFPIDQNVTCNGLSDSIQNLYRRGVVEKRAKDLAGSDSDEVDETLYWVECGRDQAWRISKADYEAL